MERPPFTVSHILEAFKSNPEGLAIVLTYYTLPRIEALQMLDENIFESLQEKEQDAADTLIMIKQAILKTTIEEHDFIRAWAKKQVHKATGKRI